MENKKPHGGSHNTFIFGVLIGVLITLLFTTKKGRKLLKVITEEGMDKLTHWEDMVDKVERKVEKVKNSVKEELYQDEVYEDESVLGEGEEINDDMEEEAEELVDEAEEELEEVEEEVEEEPQPKTHHKLERIELPRQAVKKIVHKTVVKKEEAESAKPKRRLFKGIRKKA